MKRINANIQDKAWVCDARPRTVERVVSVVRGITNRLRSHDFVGNPNVLTWLLGREPTAVDQYVANRARLQGIS